VIVQVIRKRVTKSNDRESDFHLQLTTKEVMSEPSKSLIYMQLLIRRAIKRCDTNTFYSYYETPTENHMFYWILTVPLTSSDSVVFFIEKSSKILIRGTGYRTPISITLSLSYSAMNWSWNYNGRLIESRMVYRMVPFSMTPNPDFLLWQFNVLLTDYVM